MNEPLYDPRVPPAQECVLRPVLERHAAERPDKVFARFEDGAEWTYAETLRRTRRTAAGLQKLGVRQGDTVLTWLPNGPDAMRTWFALSYLGAICVPINVSYRGRLLEHVLHNAGARLLIAHAELVERLEGIDPAGVRELVVLGGTARAVDGLVMHRSGTLDASEDELAPLERDIAPWDTQFILYTSGTTGPSKGVVCSYLHIYSASVDPMPFREDDRQLVNLPLFHVGGTNAVYGMLMRGASVAIVDAFDTASFWDVIRRTQTTVVILLAGMATLLKKRPPSREDRNHGLRLAIMIPLSEDAQAFCDRFGCEIFTLFNMTEISAPIVSGRNPGPLGTCGRPRAGIEARVVDENDCEVRPGEVGELVVRAQRPWAMSTEYFCNPGATARSWRNGWFHTGDAFRVDGQGNFFFVDRIKDAIRRRGENISSFEVEAEVCTFPQVQEAAAVGVADPDGGEEVLVVVVPTGGGSLDCRGLIEHLIPRLPHFMVPRYVRVVDELPKTPTAKVQKHVLRTQGLAGEVWDREAEGIVLRRQKLR